MSSDGGVLGGVEYSWLSDLWHDTKDVATDLWDGGKWIWGEASSLAEGAAAAIKKGWKGVEVFAAWVKDKVLDGAELWLKVLERDFESAYGALKAAVDLLVTSFGSIYEGYADIARGVDAIYHGHWKDGLLGILTGLAKMTVVMAADLVTTVAADALSILGTVLFLEPQGRPLRDDEMSAVAQVHGHRWWLKPVLVKEGRAYIFWALAKPFGGARPFTNQLTIYTMDDKSSPSLMVHETMHVWQFVHGGTDYKIKSLWDQIRRGNDWSYDWRRDVEKTAPAVPRPWGQLHVEQQAQLVQEAWEAGFFDKGNGVFSDNGYGLTKYMWDCWVKIRKGEGAP